MMSPGIDREIAAAVFCLFVLLALWEEITCALLLAALLSVLAPALWLWSRLTGKPPRRHRIARGGPRR